MRKRYMQNKVQPGEHQNIYTQTQFKGDKRSEFLQFFGSTDIKIAPIEATQTNSIVGPGTYEDRFAEIKRRALTANLNGVRKDLLFNGNKNPGP
jgi:hypothetical protein